MGPRWSYFVTDAQKLAIGARLRQCGFSRHIGNTGEGAARTRQAAAGRASAQEGGERSSSGIEIRKRVPPGYMALLQGWNELP